MMMMMATGSLFQSVPQWLWWGFEGKGRMKGLRCTGKALGSRLERSTKHTERKGGPLSAKWVQLSPGRGHHLALPWTLLLRAEISGRVAKGVCT